MGRIINVTDDAAEFNRIKDLVNTTASIQDIDNNPLFRLAENYIIGLVPSATDRMYANRAIILSALELCAAYYMLSGGGTTTAGGGTAGTGAIKSRTRSLDDMSLTEVYDVGTSSGTFSATHDDRVDFFKEQCDILLASIGANVTPTTSGGVSVGLTKSRL